MSFNENLPRQLAELRIKYASLRWERADMYHDCGCEYCEYCEYYGLNDGYTKEDVEAIDKEMQQIDDTFKRVKGYAAAHNIDVSDETIRKIEKQIRQGVSN